MALSVYDSVSGKFLRAYPPEIVFAVFNSTVNTLQPIYSFRWFYLIPSSSNLI